MNYLGVDVGGTKVALRLESDGESPREASVTWAGTGDVRQDLAQLAAQARLLASEWPGPIHAVGVAMPATLDADGRVIAWPSRPSWVGLDLNAALGRLFGPATVRCADDGDLAAIAEADAAGCADVVYLGVGTGIGGGVVLDGRPCPGPARGSCEVGHIIIDRAGPRCDCGRIGCVQAVASGAATLRRAGAARGAPVTFDELRTAWLAGDDWAASTVDDTCAALAAAVVSLGELLRPSLTLIGGGFAAGLPGFVPAVAEHTARLSRPGHPPAPVRAAALGGVSSLYGALLLARSAAT